MLHTVEFSSFCGGFLAPLSNMFAWLDARGLRPVISRQVDGDGTAVCLGFSSGRHSHSPAPVATSSPSESCTSGRKSVR